MNPELHPGLPWLAQAAFTSYVRTRDYCSTPKHILAMCLNVIKVSIEMGNYVHVSNYVQKAEQVPDVQVRRLARDQGEGFKRSNPMGALFCNLQSSQRK